MNKLHRTILGFLVLLLILPSGCAGGSQKQPTDADPDPESATQEEPATSEEPPLEEETSAVSITFEGTDLQGNTVTSDIFYQSKLTMVNIWATYCAPCLNEMPGLGELAAEYDTQEFQIIGIISDVNEGEDQTLAESLVQQTGADYPQLLLNDSIYQALLTNVSAVPTTFFFDGEGTCLGGVVGSGEKSAWEEVIHELLEML